MAKYKSYKELFSNTLKEGDQLIFNKIGLNYIVYNRFLGCLDDDNDAIFETLHLNKNSFCNAAYGYKNRHADYNNFPESIKEDFEALTRVALALFKEYEKQHCPECFELNKTVEKINKTISKSNSDVKSSKVLLTTKKSIKLNSHIKTIKVSVLIK